MVAERAGAHPYLPVRREPVVLAVRPDRAEAALGDDVGHRLGDERIRIIGLGTEPANARLRHERAPREPAALLGVLPHVALLEPVLDAPRTGTSDDECRRI